MIALPSSLTEAAQTKGIVVMAGAGVSVAPPSSLPGWYPLNRAIFDAVCDRVDAFYEKPTYTADVRQLVHARRNADQFPPDYQAQILEAQCGEVYFRALKSVDVPVYNAAHAGIAHLAKQGVVKAIVTTNFDRLIEKALESEGVPFEVAFEPAGYERCAALLQQHSEKAPLQIIKIHGCARDHLSMIDTLKQRLLGRNQHLIHCLEQLLASYLWLYMGFSAADLESDPDYLGIAAAAGVSPGLVYVQWPGSEKLNRGAEMLLERYAGKADVVKAECNEVLETLAATLGLAWEEFQPEEGDNKLLVGASLKEWASGLSPVHAVMCLAGILEANGETEAAFEVLHKLWNLRTNNLAASEHFPAFRLMHGRLGMGQGMLSLIDDLDTNRGVESIQNLLRTANSEPRALAWGGVAWAWAGDIARTGVLMAEAESVFANHAATPESKLDVWFAMAEVLFLTAENMESFIQNFGAVQAWGEESGDLPRYARAVSLFKLMLAEYMPALYEEFEQTYAQPVFAQAQRLNDPAVEGFKQLARGRLSVRQQRGNEAFEALSSAAQLLGKAGRLPWVTYGHIECVWALMDLHELDRAAVLLNQINERIDRHQVLLPWYLEAHGQLLQLLGRQEEAAGSFQSAVNFASQMGLHQRAAAYQRYLQ